MVRQSFERVLQTYSIGLDDDFFELGGDSILAMSLILDIEESFGVDVCATALFDFPSIVAMTSCVMQAMPLRPQALAFGSAPAAGAI